MKSEGSIISSGGYPYTKPKVSVHVGYREITRGWRITLRFVPPIILRSPPVWEVSRHFGKPKSLGKVVEKKKWTWKDTYTFGKISVGRRVYYFKDRMVLSGHLYVDSPHTEEMVEVLRSGGHGLPPLHQYIVNEMFNTPIRKEWKGGVLLVEGVEIPVKVDVDIYTSLVRYVDEVTYAWGGTSTYGRVSLNSLIDCDFYIDFPEIGDERRVGEILNHILQRKNPSFSHTEEAVKGSYDKYLRRWMDLLNESGVPYLEGKTSFLYPSLYEKVAEIHIDNETTSNLLGRLHNALWEIFGSYITQLSSIDRMVVDYDHLPLSDDKLSRLTSIINTLLFSQVLQREEMAVNISLVFNGRITPSDIFNVDLTVVKN